MLVPFASDAHALPRRLRVVFFPLPPARNRFCSLSWYDRQLVENSRSADKKGDPSKADEVLIGEGEEEEELAESNSGEVVVAGKASTGSGESGGASPPTRLCGSDGGFGVGFGGRARSGEASVMATLKARKGLSIHEASCSSSCYQHIITEAWKPQFSTNRQW